MRINVHLLAKSMIGAAQSTPGAPDWMRAHPMVELQLKSLATVTGEIDTMLRLGKVDEQRARNLYAACRTGVRGVLLDDGGEPTLTDGMLQAASKVIAGPMGRAVAGGRTFAFKAGKDL